MKALAFLLVALLAACGGKSGSDSSTTPADPAAGGTGGEMTPADTGSEPAGGGGATADPLASLGPDEIARGKEIYEGDCAFCHGDNAEGNKKTPALRGEGALSRFASNQELLDYTVAEMPKTDPGSMSQADIAAVLAWLKSGS